jgi:fructose-specific phosphotransferase system IIC component
MKRHIFSILGYIFATFLVQGMSHFLIFARHYAGISILKPEPNFALGFASMVIQGAILSFLFMNSRFDNGKLKDAVQFAWLFGAFLVSYIALAEAGKYSVPSIPSWIAVEAGAGFVQFTLIGLLYGLAHRKWPLAVPQYSQ